MPCIDRLPAIPLLASDPYLSIWDARRHHDPKQTPATGAAPQSRFAAC
ncbi:MAG: hypothetical protein ACLVEX_07945 [Ruthenibacterium lactatiformans]